MLESTWQKLTPEQKQAWQHVADASFDPLKTPYADKDRVEAKANNENWWDHADSY